MHNAGRELRVTPKNVLPETLALLQQYLWPGNVRQLENMARWLTAMVASDTIHPEDLPPELQSADTPPIPGWHQALRTWAQGRLTQGDTALLQQAVPAFETIMLEVALAHTGGHKQEAAQILGWGRNTLARKIKELGLASDADQNIHRVIA